MPDTDALGRATFHFISPRADIAPNGRDICWLKHIERHGPLTSVHLYEMTKDTHRCKDTALRRLQALRAAGLLFLPKQQRACERAEFRPYVYDLAPKGQLFLKDAGLKENTVRPTGHWWHLHDTAMFTAQIDLRARQGGYRYIPAHEILKRAGTSLAIPMGRRKLIPDQLFAIDYGGRFRAFMVEVDRGTEPIASTSTRKSWASALTQYDEAFRLGLPNRHYGLKAPVQVLWGHRTEARCGAFARLLKDATRMLAARYVSTRLGSGKAALEEHDGLRQVLRVVT
ncbi:replication-relaxation family protein [Gymnodinialimonas ceratoperidinii]|uniref:Replication-relaxation family protein n=1 Tax=Gymnodinialimonas ceratoperidinii TaxID=2856823 RepID=A0A8F6YCE4_9RHOB|nr:replication-relaxation family protein [Gymnodinialimonas ceratoperidinii]QXT41151.1 replication-relaxation family protein [Gymnodinialimonas ceratoperidinii]